MSVPLSSLKPCHSFVPVLIDSACVQMDEVLERLSAQEKDIASVGTTLVQTEQLLKDLEMLDKHAEVREHA